MSAFDWYRKPGISREKANETVHHGRNVSEKKKVKPSKELLTFLSFTETTENFLYHCCTWITNARPPTERKRKIYLFFFFFFFIAQNAYCSRDIYFQFNKVCRSVISCVDAMKAPQRLVALNALGCSLIWCRWQTKQRGQLAIVSPFIRKSHICAYFAATF